jgi:sulfide:quinone oxidoreductase
MDTVVRLSPFLSVSPQLSETDIGISGALGFRTILNSRPDGETEGQPTSAAIEAAARRHGLDYRYLPVISGKITDGNVEDFGKIMAEVRGPVLAYCRTGTRSTSLWALHEARHLDPEAILKACAAAGYHLDALRPKLEARWTGEPAGSTPAPVGATGMGPRGYDVVIVGGGAAGIATAASLLRRRPSLAIAVIEPGDKHYYQAGWTLVGAGLFDRRKTERPMDRVMPSQVTWLRSAVAGFEPEHHQVVLEEGARVRYRTLVVCPGIRLNWDGVEGLRETLGRNGVTSNYMFDLSSYTRQLVQGLRGGRALFTQPPMPIKCAGAPQKAMYLSCDQWQRRGVLSDIDVEFNTAGMVLFGVPDYVPSLMSYVERYKARLCFGSTLVAIDGPGRKAWFNVKQDDGSMQRVEKGFDMIHVCPPQTAPDFVRASPLADAAGWVEVSPETLQHPRFGNIFGLGDACSTPNAKTAAAVRKQAPVVAENVLGVLDGKGPRALYDGYGSCPLVVERGKVVLAEFLYGGKLAPSIPFLDSTRPRWLGWFMKTRMFPVLYFDFMLKGREWLAKPQRLPHQPTAHEAAAACDFSDSAASSKGSR